MVPEQSNVLKEKQFDTEDGACNKPGAILALNQTVGCPQVSGKCPCRLACSKHVVSQVSEGETSGPEVGVAGRLRGVELP